MGQREARDVSLVVEILSQKPELRWMEVSPDRSPREFWFSSICKLWCCSLAFCLWFGGGENLLRVYLFYWPWKLWNHPTFIVCELKKDLRHSGIRVMLMYAFFLRKSLVDILVNLLKGSVTSMCVAHGNAFEFPSVSLTSFYILLWFSSSSSNR